MLKILFPHGNSLLKNSSPSISRNWKLNCFLPLLKLINGNELLFLTMRLNYKPNSNIWLNLSGNSGLNTTNLSLRKRILKSSLKLFTSLMSPKRKLSMLITILLTAFIPKFFHCFPLSPWWKNPSKTLNSALTLPNIKKIFYSLLTKYFKLTLR